jgi:hypothetical protein
VKHPELITSRGNERIAKYGVDEPGQAAIQPLATARVDEHISLREAVSDALAQRRSLLLIYTYQLFRLFAEIAVIRMTL